MCLLCWTRNLTLRLQNEVFFLKEREAWEIIERKKWPRDLPVFEPRTFRLPGAKKKKNTKFEITILDIDKDIHSKCWQKIHTPWLSDCIHLKGSDQCIQCTPPPPPPPSREIYHCSTETCISRVHCSAPLLVVLRYPALHTHWNDPLLFTQAWLIELQPWELVEHSSISGEKNKGKIL